MRLRARLDHYEYVVMPFGLTFVVITLHMVYYKSPCLHSLPCGGYVGTMFIMIGFRGMQDVYMNGVWVRVEYNYIYNTCVNKIHARMLWANN